MVRTKRFPFAPGINWELIKGISINPKIDNITWNSFLSNNQLIITVFGNLVESVFSLTVTEALKQITTNNIQWAGNKEYESLSYINGIGSFCNINITQEIVKKYPTPLFKDAKNNVYFNLLNDYLIRKTYWGTGGYPRKESVFEQMFSNVMIPWSKEYLPKMRRLGTDFIDDLIKQNKITGKSKIITLILENTDKDILEWKVPQIKEFVQIMHSKGYKVIIFSDDIGYFHGSKALLNKKEIRHIIQMIKKSCVVLSNNVQWLLVTLLLSSAAIISKNVIGPYDLFKNAEYIQVENDIFTFAENISTLEVATICERF